VVLYGVIVWPIALVHVLVTSPAQAKIDAKSIASHTSKKCPQCAELVKFEATKCRFCGHDFPAGGGPPLRPTTHQQRR
jgi:hypothetical protein